MQLEELFNYNHKLATSSVLLKTLWVFPAFILVIFSNNSVFHIQLFLLFVSSIFIIVRPPFFKLIKIFLIPGTFIFLGCITLIFSINLEASFLKMVYLNEEMYPIAVVIFSRSYALISILYFWLLTQTISEIAFGMRAIKIPSLFIELFVLTYKFIFLVLNSFKAMLLAQKCRLAYSSTRKNAIQSYSFLFSAVFTKAMQQTSQIEIAMASRLGNNEFYFLKPKSNFKANDLLIMLGFNAVIIIFFLIFVI